MEVGVYVCVKVCRYICMYMYMCVCTYIYVCTLKNYQSRKIQLKGQKGEWFICMYMCPRTGAPLFG